MIFIRASGQTFGPYNDEELRSHLEGGKIPFSAWVHREGEWKLLAELPDIRASHPEFESAPTFDPQETKASRRLAPSLAQGGVSRRAGSGVESTISAEPVWFVVRDKKKYGPYSAADIVSQLQRKDLEPNAFVWRPGFATWQKLSSVSEFSPETMRRLASDGTPLDIFVKRKFQRSPYEIEVIAHDNKRVIEGKSMVIGEGGLFLATPRPSHTVGSRLRLHFREGDVAAFNAVAEVVSVVRGKAPGYCLKFVALSEADRRRIAKLVTEQKPKR